MSCNAELLRTKEQQANGLITGLGSDPDEAYHQLGNDPIATLCSSKSQLVRTRAIDGIFPFSTGPAVRIVGKTDLFLSVNFR